MHLTRLQTPRHAGRDPSERVVTIVGMRTVFLQVVKTVRLRLKNPPKSVEDYFDTLRAQGLLATVRAIEPFDQFI